MIFWILTVLFTLFMYFLNKTIIAYKEDVNYKKYLYISSLTIYIYNINFGYYDFDLTIKIK